MRKAGLWALWLGVEDMSGTLVKKGQSAEQTVEAFRLLRAQRHLSHAHAHAPRRAAALDLDETTAACSIN